MGGSSLSPFEVAPRYDESVLLVIVRRGERGREDSSFSSSGVGRPELRPNLLDSELKADGREGLRSGDSDTLSGMTILLSRFLLRPSNVPSLFKPPLEPDFCFSGSTNRSDGAAKWSAYLHIDPSSIKLTSSRSHTCPIIVMRSRSQRRRNKYGLAVPDLGLFGHHISARDTQSVRLDLIRRLNVQQDV
jgi:hypothetical protein